MAANNITPTLPTSVQIWGDDRGEGQLEIIKKYPRNRGYGTGSKLSDLAILLGGAVFQAPTSHSDNSGIIWTQSSNSDGHIITNKDAHGVSLNVAPNWRYVSVRPVLTASDALSITPDGFVPSGNPKNFVIDIVTYGEYPQTIAPEALQAQLESAFTHEKLTSTGKSYTFDANGRYDTDKPFEAQTHAEYELPDDEGRIHKYIRVTARPHDVSSIMSNGKTPQKGESYWVEVQPIEWLVDPSGAWVARQALFAGVQFDQHESYDGKFENTDMHHYLQTYFAKEMLPQQQLKHTVAEQPAAAPTNTMTRKEKLNQIGITSDSPERYAFRKFQNIDCTEEVDGYQVSAGVIITSSDNEISRIRSQLNAILTEQTDYEDGYGVTQLPRDNNERARLHISDLCLDKLIEIGAKVDLTPPQEVRAAGAAR